MAKKVKELAKASAKASKFEGTVPMPSMKQLVLHGAAKAAHEKKAQRDLASSLRGAELEERITALEARIEMLSAPWWRKAADAISKVFKRGGAK